MPVEIGAKRGVTTLSPLPNAISWPASPGVCILHLWPLRRWPPRPIWHWPPAPAQRRF